MSVCQEVGELEEWRSRAGSIGVHVPFVHPVLILICWSGNIHIVVHPQRFGSILYVNVRTKLWNPIATDTWLILFACLVWNRIHFVLWGGLFTSYRTAINSRNPYSSPLLSSAVLCFTMRDGCLEHLRRTLKVRKLEQRTQPLQRGTWRICGYQLNSSSLALTWRRYDPTAFKGSSLITLWLHLCL